jgi:uncharacterized membrane protein YcjF (UPF0283 family)
MGFGVSKGSRFALLGMAALVCSSVVEADENWNMKMYNKKQYMYFICTFEQ